MYLLEKNFENAKAEDLAQLKKYFKACEYKSSGHTFTSMYMWGPEYEASWQVIDGYLWTVSSYIDEKNRESYYTTMPLTLKGYDVQSLRSSMHKIKDIFDKIDSPMVLYQVPNHLVRTVQLAWDRKMQVKEDRDSFDYVYDRKKMESLPGRALHKKKNNLNTFIKNYDYSSEELKECDIEEAIAFAESFNEEKDSASKKDSLVLENETKAIKRALENRDEYIARVIKMNGEIQALAIGALINEKEAVEHIEKANPTLRGLFQLVAVEFARNLPENVKLINREEDMGIENLRRSKEGYQPVKMYEKSTVILY